MDGGWGEFLLSFLAPPDQEEEYEASNEEEACYSADHTTCDRTRIGTGRLERAFPNWRRLKRAKSGADDGGYDGAGHICFGCIDVPEKEGKLQGKGGRYDL